jgi:hypothetical protein
MTQPSHHPPATTPSQTPLTKPNLTQIPPTSSTKLETFVNTYENSEKLALGDPSPRSNMEEVLKSWEEQWETIDRGVKNDMDIEKRVTTPSRI